MTFIHGLILGAIEGLSEFLPISSTAHLLLAGKLWHLPTDDFSKTFAIVIQLGAILAVAGLYIKQILRWEAIKRIAAAFLPTAVVGFLLYKIIKNIFFENLYIVVGALILGGIGLIFFERHYKKRNKNEEDTAAAGIENIGYGHCLIIGLCQSLAIIPGVSRAAATIIGGLALGIKRKTIVEFSFLLALPTMVAASGYDLYKNGANFSADQIGIIAVGFLTALIVALIAVKVFVRYVAKHDFQAFGIYRIVIGLLFLLWLI